MQTIKEKNYYEFQRILSTVELNLEYTSLIEVERYKEILDLD